jgi:hypothetical protein
MVNFADIGTEPELKGLDADDKLVLKTMEADILRAQIQVQQTQAAAKDAISRLDTFAKDLLEKYNRDPKEWTLSLEKLEFVSRNPKPAGA